MSNEANTRGSALEIKGREKLRSIKEKGQERLLQVEISNPLIDLDYGEIKRDKLYTDGLHFVGGDLELLHFIAQEIGLKHSWFQDEFAVPHYDILSEKVLKKAIRKGVIKTDTKSILLVHKKYNNPFSFQFFKEIKFNYGQGEKILKILSKNPDLIYAVDERDRNALVLTTNDHHFKATQDYIILMSLKYGININYQDIRGRTALYWAVYWKSKLLVLNLLERGAYTLIEDVDGKTPYDFAIWERKVRETSLTKIILEAIQSDLRRKGIQMIVKGRS